MAKILVLCNRLDLGGTEVSMKALLEKLIENKHNVTLLVNEKAGEMADKLPSEITIKELPIPSKFDLYIGKTQKNKLILYWKKFKRKLLRLFKTDLEINEYILNKMDDFEENFDIALDFYGYGNFLTGYCAKKVKATKKATWFHDENLMWFDFTKGYLDQYDRWFCVSEAVKKSLIQTLGREDEHIEVFYNLINANAIKKRADEEIDISEFKGNYRILSVGRLAYQKGFDIAIEAANVLKEKNVDFTWYIIGEGVEHQNLENLIKEHFLEDYIKLLGERENPFPYMKECELYVQTSRHEGYGITLLEARALSKPIVATDIDSFKEQIKDQENGLITTHDPAKIAAAILFMKNNPDFREACTAKLKAEIIDFEDYFKVMENFINEINIVAARNTSCFGVK